MVCVYMRYVYKWLVHVNAHPRFLAREFQAPMGTYLGDYGICTGRGTCRSGRFGWTSQGHTLFVIVDRTSSYDKESVIVVATPSLLSVAQSLPPAGGRGSSHGYEDGRCLRLCGSGLGDHTPLGVVHRGDGGPGTKPC